MGIREETNCRVCKNELETILDFGEIYLSGFVKDQSQAMKAPLALARCKSCGLVQLKHTVDLDLMYRQYWYTSSLNKSMVSSLQKVVRYIEGLISLEDRDIVLDIGCNDGTLLGLYTNQEVTKVGFDPAVNIETSSNYWKVLDYFSASTFLEMFRGKKAKVITAIAMFYDLPDPNKFVSDIVESLDSSGIFVLQLTDLYSMFKVTAFDNICHEHLEYYRLEDIMNLLESHNLRVIDVSYNDVNGGSIRITAAHPGAFEESYAVRKALQMEREYFKTASIEDFKTSIEITKQTVRSFLDECKKQNLSVYLLGASTKGNTFLQVCGITDADIPYAAEVNPEKFGLLTAGSNIHIIPEENALRLNPNFFLVPVWHFKNSLVSSPKIREYINGGGTLVFPLPEFNLVQGEKGD